MQAAATQPIEKRSVTVAGHPTSVSLEPAFWTALKAVAAKRGRSLNALVTEVDAEAHGAAAGNLSSALRVFVLRCYQSGELP